MVDVSLLPGLLGGWILGLGGGDPSSELPPGPQQGRAAQAGWLQLQGDWRQKSELQHSERLGVLSDLIIGARRAGSLRKVKRQGLPHEGRVTRCSKKKKKKKKERKGDSVGDADSSAKGGRDRKECWHTGLRDLC